MSKKSKIREEVKLTATELEFMNILWALEEGGVNDVRDQLPSSRELAYTSVATILRLLEQKKVLKSRKQGREHIFTPQISKHEYERSALNQVVRSVFDNTPSALVLRLLSNSEIPKEEMETIRKLIDERLDS